MKTNKEKALELSGLTSINEDERYYQPRKCEIYDKCLEIAEWKDGQTKIAIEKAKAEAQLEILEWMKYEVATYYVKEQVVRKIRYIKKKLNKLNDNEL